MKIRNTAFSIGQSFGSINRKW